MHKNRRIFCIILVIMLCVSMTGCVEAGRTSKYCKDCHHTTWMNETDIIASKDFCIQKSDIVRVVNHNSYSGTIEGESSATGVLVFYHSKSSISGTVSEEKTYSFYYVTSDGGYKEMTIPVGSTTIYYTSEQPHIEIYSREYKLWYCENCGQGWYSDKVKYYKLYVPEGSITEEYKFD